jgi:hypothetical protein
MTRPLFIISWIVLALGVLFLGIAVGGVYNLAAATLR